MPASIQAKAWETVVCQLYGWDRPLPVLCKNCWYEKNVWLCTRLQQLQQETNSPRAPDAKRLLERYNLAKGYYVMAHIPDKALANDMISEWERRLNVGPDGHHQKKGVSEKVPLEQLLRAQRDLMRKAWPSREDPHSWWKDTVFAERVPLTIPVSELVGFCQQLQRLKPTFRLRDNDAAEPDNVPFDYRLQCETTEARRRNAKNKNPTEKHRHIPSLKTFLTNGKKRPDSKIISREDFEKMMEHVKQNMPRLSSQVLDVKGDRGFVS